MFAYLSKKAVIAINWEIASHYSQPHAVIAEANLEHLLEAVRHYGEAIGDPEEKLLRKAAFLLYHLAYDTHAFADGNKRTALISTATFMNLNSYSIRVKGDAGQEEMAKIMKETAEGKKSMSSICKWLKSAAKPD